MELLKKILVLILSLNLSGALTVASSAVAYDATPASGTVNDDFDEHLRLLIRRAKHQGTPGTPAGIPTFADLAAVELRFVKIKGKLEKLMALPNTPEGVTNGAAQIGVNFIPDEGKIQAINQYFNRLSLLATLRIALNLSRTQKWTDQYALNVPRDRMKDFGGLATLAQNRFGDRFFPLVIDMGTNGQADPVQLKISQSLMQGLEVGSLTTKPDDPSFLTMTQYLAIRQLLQNLASLRYLKQDRSISVPKMPASIVRKLESMSATSLIMDEQRQAIAEPGARMSILEQYNTVRDQVPMFVDDTLVNEIAALIVMNPKDRYKVIAPLGEALREAERDNLPAAIEEEVMATSLPVSSLHSEQLNVLLRLFLSNAKANTQLNKLMQLMADQVIVLRTEDRHKIIKLIDDRKSRFESSLQTTHLKTWSQAAKRANEDTLYTSRRNGFVEELIVRSPEASKDVRETYAGATILPSLLGRSMALDLAEMNPRSSVRDWLYEVTQENTYVSARDKFAELIGQITSPRVLFEGRVDPARVERFVETHDFDTDIRFSHKVNPKLARTIIERVTEGRKKDVRNFLQLGELMGFTKPFLADNPKVKDVLTENRYASYFDALDNEVLSRYPILAMDVAVRTSSGGLSSQKLYSALNAINRNNQMSESLLKEASLLVDQALIKLEQQIIANIRTVAQAKTLQDIESVVQSSLMLELVMRGYPEFRVQQDRFAEEMLRPSFMHQIMHKQLGRYFSVGLGAFAAWAILAIAKKGVKSTAPYVDPMLSAFGPFMHGFFHSMTLVFIADGIYQGHELFKFRDQTMQNRDFFMSGAEYGSFIQKAELDSINSAYSMNKWFFAGRMVLDSVLLYRPMIKGLATKIGTRMTWREFKGDVDAFRALKLEPGQWAKLDKALTRIYADKTISLEALTKADRAHARLTAKIRSGQNWNIDAIRAGNPESKTDKKLYAVLKPLIDAEKAAQAGGR